MKILSIYWGICSSASLIIDKKVVASLHEERFTRTKNDDSFPQFAISEVLKIGNIDAQDLDAVAIASHYHPIDDNLLLKSTWTIDDYLTEQHERWKPFIYDNKPLRSILEIFPSKKKMGYPSNYSDSLKGLSTSERQDKYNIDRKKILADFLKIDQNKIRTIEHHRCHAYYSYYMSDFKGKETLSFTIDGAGDGKNATIGIFDKDGTYKTVFETNECNIGRIYRYITLVLGMKPNEHEYKVMGLAPYGKEKHSLKALEAFRNTLYVDGIEFKWKEKPKDSYFWFKEKLEGVRFDNVAFALQKWVEEVLTDWVKNAVNKFGISNIILSGGVAMNIKAMGKISELPEVQNIFVGGSSSDESMAISAGICLYEDLIREKKETWKSSDFQDIPNLYLGSEPTIVDEKELISKIDTSKFIILENPELSIIAKYLYDGKILARCCGRMEFGQRALGNRSILADPLNVEAKEKINQAIKSRDFWMPFAPIILDEFEKKYIINPKNIKSPYMTIAFNTTDEGYNSMKAAAHPADKSVRAQVLNRSHNPDLYDLIQEFKKLSGRGSILNTSFNLHGYPIVSTPDDAFDVFIRSGLDGLILNHYLILKR